MTRSVAPSHFNLPDAPPELFGLSQQELKARGVVIDKIHGQLIYTYQNRRYNAPRVDSGASPSQPFDLKDWRIVHANVNTGLRILEHRTTGRQLVQHPAKKVVEAKKPGVSPFLQF